MTNYGIDIVKNKDLKKILFLKKLMQLNFKKNNVIFDLILIKQTIHFFSKKQINLC